MSEMNGVMCTEHGDMCYPHGACPACGSMEYLNVYKDQWGCCAEHRVRWLFGSNLFSSWRHEDEAVWARNRELLDSYAEVDPIFVCEKAVRLAPAAAATTCDADTPF